MAQLLPLAPDAVASAWELADAVLAREGWGNVEDEQDKYMLFRMSVHDAVAWLYADDPQSKKDHVLRLCWARTVLRLALL